MARPAAPVVTEHAPRRLRVLLAEDNRVNQLVAVKHLEDARASRGRGR